ncbi:HD domain-containing protein [Evansella tamaricis]|uniref:HD domain-containing protein n=1 Tax=Evansella tamaricis TaxID=2069301 RepID=A0ABS6JGE3_9BACI|nr:HD domain-containing protein [Evansella tamaricis]MBU9711515.1 HD domain-containing protein [Evansella tamaricis]
MNFKKIHEAVTFATKVHEGQTRKSTPIPYVTHPITAAIYIQPSLDRAGFTEGEQEDIIISTILHDVWEDTDTTLEELRDKFGKEVMELVKGASEADKTKTWHERKTATIEKVPEASLALKYVILADKLHNLVSMLEAKEQVGDKIWESFKGRRDLQEWYYTSMYEALIDGMNPIPDLFQEMKKHIDEIFKR